MKILSLILKLNFLILFGLNFNPKNLLNSNFKLWIHLINVKILLPNLSSLLESHD